MPEIGTYSEVALANLALQGLGRGALITDLSETSQAARLAKQHLPYARDATLRAYPWNFAQARAELAKDATAPPFEFANAYTLPTDCLWCHTIYEGASYDWKVEGRQILTDLGDPIFIKYTRRVTDLAASDPLFFDALAARLGSMIALGLTESASKARDMWQVYMAKIREARAVDAQEGQADRLPLGSWHDDRLGGGRDFSYADWREDW